MEMCLEKQLAQWKTGHLQANNPHFQITKQQQQTTGTGELTDIQISFIYYK